MYYWVGLLGLFSSLVFVSISYAREKGNLNEPTARALIVNIDFFFITYLSQKKISFCLRGKNGRSD